MRLGPKVYLCRGCTFTHSTREGAHFLETIPCPQKFPKTVKTENSHEVPCFLCKVEKAKHLCLCAQPPITLCHACVERHTNEQPWAKHAYFPASLLERFSSLGFLAEFKARQKRVRHMNERFEKMLSEMTTAREDIIRQSDAIIEALITFRNKKLSEIDGLKQDFEQKINNAMREIQKSMYEETLDSSDTLAISVWNQVTNDTIFPKFNYVADSVRANMRAVIDAAMHVSVQLAEKQASFISVIADNELKQFDCRSGCWLPTVALSGTFSFDAGSSLLMVDSGDVFVCGSFDPITPSASLISSVTGLVTPQREMTVARGWAGSCKYRRTIYILGGIRSRNLKRSEKFDLDSGEWNPLPNMLRSRSGFNPCLVGHCLYIAGGDNNAHVEMLNLSTETIESLGIMMPGGKYTVLLAHGEDFIAIQEEKYFAVSIREKRVEKAEKELAMCVCANQSPPVVVAGETFLVDEDGGIVALDVRSMRCRIISEQ